MSIYSVQNDINFYNSKIVERKNFISKINSLKENTKTTSTHLKTASDNLNLGLIIDEKPADDGKLNEFSGMLEKSISKLDNAVSVANDDIRVYTNKIDSLKRELTRLERLQKLDDKK